MISRKKREYKREIFLTDWLDDMWKIAIIEKEKQPRLNNVSSGHMSCWIAASAHPTEGKDVDYSGIFSLSLSINLALLNEGTRGSHMIILLAT